MTAETEIDYDALAQEAMRGVVRAVLTRVQKSGLPGNHHFYIAFDTRHPGVVLSKRLKGKYAEEMTIVLQHVFWELLVTDARFEVKLRFDGIPERLVIPFEAIKVFFDPSVPYALQFEESDRARSGSVVGMNEEAGAPGMPRVPNRNALTDKKRPPKRTRTEKDDETDLPGDELPVEQPHAPAASLVPVPAADEDERDTAAVTPSPDPGQDNVISLDRFRKKP